MNATMKLISIDQVGFEDIFRTLLDFYIASRFDILMLAVGVATYLTLFSARSRWKISRKLPFDKIHHEEQTLESQPCLPEKPDLHGLEAFLSWNVIEDSKKLTSATVQHKEQKPELQTSLSAKTESQGYEAALSLHVGKHEYGQVENLIESIQAEQVILKEDAVNSMLNKSICSNDTDMATLLEGLVKSQPHCSDTTTSLLIQALSRQQARTIVNEVLERTVGSDPSFGLVLSILGFCRTSLADRPMVDRLLDRMETADTDMLSEFIHFYLDSNQFEKACDVFELNFATFFENELGQDMEWSLMVAALKCGRVSVANHLYETSQFSAARHVPTIQKWWRHSACGIQSISREQEIGDIFGRLAHAFHERFPFEEDSNAGSSGESTVLLDDDDDDIGDISDFDSDYDASNLNCDY